MLCRGFSISFQQLTKDFVLRRRSSTTQACPFERRELSPSKTYVLLLASFLTSQLHWNFAHKKNELSSGILQNTHQEQNLFFNDRFLNAMFNYSRQSQLVG